MKTEFHSISLPIQFQYYTFYLFNLIGSKTILAPMELSLLLTNLLNLNNIYLPSMFIPYLIFEIIVFTPTWSSAISDRCCLLTCLLSLILTPPITPSLSFQLIPLNIISYLCRLSIFCQGFIFLNFYLLFISTLPVIELFTQIHLFRHPIRLSTTFYVPFLI
jgi:hypothetical protein